MSIVDFALSEITHITADEGMPPSDGDTSAPRCAGGPFSTDVRPDLPDEHDTGSSLQEQIADLRVQLRHLGDLARTEPILTREQARQRDVAHKELQSRTLVALGSLVNGEALWEDSTQTILARHQASFARDRQQFIGRMYPGTGTCLSFSQHLGQTVVMNHVSRLREGGDHGECVQIMAMVHSAMVHAPPHAPPPNAGNTGVPRCGDPDISPNESTSDTEDTDDGILADNLFLTATEGSPKSLPSSGLWTLDQR